jgi:hypothetical protein
MQKKVIMREGKKEKTDGHGSRLGMYGAYSLLAIESASPTGRNTRSVEKENTLLSVNMMPVL